MESTPAAVVVTWQDGECLAGLKNLVSGAFPIGARLRSLIASSPSPCKPISRRLLFVKSDGAEILHRGLGVEDGTAV